MKRKSPLLLLFIITSLIIILIVMSMGSINVSFFDSWFYSEAIEGMNPNLTLVMRFITSCGNSVTVVILCLGLFLFTKTRRKWALPVATSVIIATISNVLLKFMFARERPNILRLVNESDYSFPSGHAMINMAFYMMLIMLTWKYVKNKRFKYAISIFYMMMPIIIGFSRIYLGVHYATDVLAGWLLGFAVAIIIYSIFYKKKAKA